MDRRTLQKEGAQQTRMNSKPYPSEELFLEAIRLKRWEEAGEYLDHIVDIPFHPCDWTFLHVAIINVAPLYIIRRLLEKGVNPNWQNEHGENLVHFAVSHCADRDTLRLLLEWGGDADHTDGRGISPILLGFRNVFDGEYSQCRFLPLLGEMLRWGTPRRAWNGSRYSSVARTCAFDEIEAFLIHTEQMEVLLSAYLRPCKLRLLFRDFMRRISDTLYRAPVG
jgi:hypothetical protein